MARLSLEDYGLNSYILEDSNKTKKKTTGYKLTTKEPWKKMVYGSSEDVRKRVYKTYPRLVQVTDSIAGEYGISPNALRTRLAAEGFIDRIANKNDEAIHYGDTTISKNKFLEDILGNRELGSGYHVFGLDDVGDFIEQNKVVPIREQYLTDYRPNDNGRIVHYADGYTNYDNIGLMAATLKYFKGEAKKAYPNASNDDLERYATIMYNRGVTGGKKYINNGEDGFVLKYSLGGSINRPSLKDGGIYIQPSHRGRFTALKERTGHSATWFKENGTPAQKKMATFALNAAKWNH